MTVTAKSDDGKVECHYDSKTDKDNYELTLTSKSGYLSIMALNRDDLPELTKTLTYFQELLRITTGR